MVKVSRKSRHLRVEGSRVVSPRKGIEDNYAYPRVMRLKGLQRVLDE